ncbi:MAG: hypothetical protein H6867_01700 [Rhodospirillales bacterium]|nr:hypothetical protein [Rhodospirillales bacterium]MCB9997232.1 hypothetical protein [Rhodospirillales bacterium]
MMSDKTPFQQGREQALKQIEDMFCHDFRRHAPHGIWNMVPPVDEPHIIEAICQMMGVKVEENLRQALTLLQQGKRLEDICEIDLLQDYEPPEENPEDYDHGRLSALADAQLLMLLMDRQVLAQPVLQDPVMSKINPRERSIAVRTLQVYSAQVLQTFSNDIRAAYEAIAPGAYTEQFMKAARQPEKKEPQTRKEKFWDWWDKGFRYWWSLPAKGTEPRVYPKIWPPLLESSAAQSSPVKSGQDLFREFSRAFQGLHFASLAGQTYEVQIKNDTGLTDTPIRSIALELFDDIRRTLFKRQEEHCTDVKSLKAYVDQTLAQMDVSAYEERYKGGGACADWLRGYWQRQANNLFRRLERVPSSVPHTPPPSPR